MIKVKLVYMSHKEIQVETTTGVAICFPEWIELKQQQTFTRTRLDQNASTRPVVVRLVHRCVKRSGTVPYI